MRELTMNEIAFVSGGNGSCSAGESSDDGGGGNNYNGITEPKDIGQDLIDAYEGVVAFASHVIERVANAF